MKLFFISIQHNLIFILTYPNGHHLISPHPISTPFSSLHPTATASSSSSTTTTSSRRSTTTSTPPHYATSPSCSSTASSLPPHCATPSCPSTTASTISGQRSDHCYSGLRLVRRLFLRRVLFPCSVVLDQEEETQDG